MEPKEILMHPKTAKTVEAFLAKPSNALMLSGPAGSGKFHLATYVAASTLNAPLANHPYFYLVKKPEGKQEIPIDAIRQMIKNLRLKTDGALGVRRVVIIEDAQSLSEEAQNALLKILEEPPEDTLFILTVTSTKSLAQTITSRAQQIVVRSLGLEQATEFLSSMFSERQINAAWNLSQGAIGLMLAILNGSDEHPLKKAVEDAKQWLKLKPDERLMVLDKYSKDRDTFLRLTDALARTLAALQHSAINKGQRRLAALLASDRRLVSDIKLKAESGANLKLAVVRLSLGMRSLV